MNPIPYKSFKIVETRRPVEVKTGREKRRERRKINRKK